MDKRPKSDQNLLKKFLESNLLLFTLLDYLEEGVLIVDNENFILASNTKISALFNVPFRRIIGLPLREVVEELIRLRPYEEAVIRLNPQRGGKENYLSCKYFPLQIGEETIKIYMLKDLIPVDEATKKRDVLKEEKPFEIITDNEQMLDLIDFAINVAKSDAPVIIQGETGTGKELIANLIHYHSYRKEKPFIKMNCAAIPETLLESELFGYTKGAFTGAYTDRPGRFELANGGTIFLDEIGEMGPSLQAKLLRVLESKTFERLGSNKSIKVDVRVISATNRDLKEEIRKGRFREDLYYRISVIPISLPPLLQRKEDIPLLINHFLREFEGKGYQKISKVDVEAMKALINYEWPGNVRELRNIIEYALVCAKDDCITLETLPDHIKSKYQPVEVKKPFLNPLPKKEHLGHQTGKHIKKGKKKYVKVTLEDCLDALKKCGNNKSLAANFLNIDRTTLYKKLKKIG